MSFLVRRIPRRTSIILLAALLAGCSSQAGSESLAIDLIDDAVAAVEERFGVESSFYEVNATSDGVNLFVRVGEPDADPGVVQARYTRSRGLVVSEEALPAEGSTFTGADLDFESAIIDAAVDQLSSSTPRVFIVTAVASTPGAAAAPGGEDADVGVVYRLVMESDRGGRLVVLLGPDGSILGSDVID